MFENLKVFQMAHAMASHASQRQNVTARNIANADTPGYKARDVAPFTDVYRAPDQFTAQKATRAGHMTDDRSPGKTRITLAADQSNMSPSGNSVSLEAEMLKSVDNQRQHDRAIMIYKSSLDVLRSAIGRR
ncbi:FlgB family protein [Parasulfitobacter algicola]|uniref:Flagellar basal body rod protein FlgB n=1 Tax=Parasulfitobacter algicola TaxID=2614809 RepID=A0ABX2IP57_9RHOB|nr:FlgB family protein [Sulfitobacter algicola]